jgi:hypothetical protein
VSDNGVKIGESDHDRIIQLTEQVASLQHDVQEDRSAAREVAHLARMAHREAMGALREQLDRERVVDQESMRLAREEIERRLVHLNGETARMTILQGSFLSRELFDEAQKQYRRDLELALAKADAVAAEMSELRGKLWLPMIVAAGIAASLATGIVYLVLK